MRKRQVRMKKEKEKEKKKEKKEKLIIRNHDCITAKVGGGMH